MTALMLLIAAGIAFALGIAFEWRSGWCASLCPIHPVEKALWICAGGDGAETRAASRAGNAHRPARIRRDR